jgi:transcription-repair coupling factor (superfamily II helicase)
MPHSSDAITNSEALKHTPQDGATRVIGALGSASGYYIASLLLDKNAPLSIIVTPTRKVAEEISDDLRFFLGSNAVALFPSWDSLPLEPVSPGVDTSAERIRILASLCRDSDVLLTNNPRAVVIASETLLQRVIPPSDIAQLTTHLKLGDAIERDTLISNLLDAGFTTVKSVVDLGELALKGAVVDLFPSTTQLPVRIELQTIPGELRRRIVRMELFDGESQRAVSELKSLTILPVRELSLKLSESYSPLGIEQRLRDRGAQLGVHTREVERSLSALKMGESYPGIELLQYIAAPELPSFIDLIPSNSTVCVLDPYQCHREIENFVHSIRERALRDGEQRDLLPLAEELYNAPDDLIHELTHRTTHEVSAVAPSDSNTKTINLRAESTIELATEMRTHVGSGSAFQPLKSFLNQWRRKGYSVALTVGSTFRAERLQGILLNIGTDAPILNDTGNSWLSSPRRAHVVILIGHLSQGFRIPGNKLCFIAESEIFGERSYRSSRRSPRVSAKRLLSTLSLLKEGDYLVHIDYGVGIYRGLKHLKVDGIMGDFLHLEYADSTLYLPAHQIGKVQKFVGTEGQKPTVDKLSSNRWVRTKQKVRDSIVTLAGDLIRLYATRSVSKGWRFEPYGAEDERFSDSFPYDETPDQLKAIEETINDLAAAKPMDRLVCGDVGFGKTEVAIRAAFKCTQHARQVAVLVPTTILVEQHKRNFVERFAGYPVKIGAISRFYSNQHNLETLAAVARGEIDIIIGTHRLLQHDVVFKDLGLLIIDEEHRFGVKQKERLRSYRTDVDVLTLTATPIPRTLHLSLLNIRDISLIQTAPTDRRVVQTYLTQRDDALVRDAILRELRRGGQAFYIHNRVQNISLIAAHLADLVPEARFDFAHGQMSELTLERIMKRFVDREIDVLIATTIIESGLDVPNANTIIIDRADQFGLAQLYQLRGRVGRGKRQAFAYLVVPNMKSLTGEAHERLKVLQSLDTLGAGFNLAIRDLEIRGAGNLLGKEQSGSVLSVGFDMYCRILQDAVAELKGDEPALEDTIDPDVRIVGVDAFLPDSYVPDIGERLVLYQRLSNIRSDNEAFEIQRELKDRFGPYTTEVDNLLMIMRYRSLLRRYGVVKADVTPVKASLNFSPLALLRDGHKANHNTRIDGLCALKLVQNEPHRYRFGKGETFSIIFDRSLGDSAPDLALIQIYDVTERTLEKIGFRG